MSLPGSSSSPASKAAGAKAAAAKLADVVVDKAKGALPKTSDPTELGVLAAIVGLAAVSLGTGVRLRVKGRSSRF